MRIRAIDRRGFMVGAAALTATAALPISASKGQQDKIVLAFIPQENPEKLIGDIDVIAAWLSDQLGIVVSGFVTTSLAAAVESLRNGDADISFMGALPYVIAENQIGANVILQEVYRGSSYYRSRIFVRADSGIETLEQLRGGTIAFADPISESGYLYPLETFVAAGLIERIADPRIFFDRTYFAGGYQQAIQAMANGVVDAAGASQYADLLLDPNQQAEVTWIAQSDPIPSHGVIARKGLDPTVEAGFVEAMMRLNEPENRSLLQHVYSPDGYVVANQEAYDRVRELARAYDLIQ